MAKIINTEDNLIEFSDGTIITCDHDQDCCEYNYADCEQIDDLARGYDFNTSKLVFEVVEGSGFVLGIDLKECFSFRAIPTKTAITRMRQTFI